MDVAVFLACTAPRLPASLADCLARGRPLRVRCADFELGYINTFYALHREAGVERDVEDLKKNLDNFHDTITKYVSPACVLPGCSLSTAAVY
jgi:hypothetical protein